MGLKFYCFWGDKPVLTPLPETVDPEGTAAPVERDWIRDEVGLAGLFKFGSSFWWAALPLPRG